MITLRFEHDLLQMANALLGATLENPVIRLRLAAMQLRSDAALQLEHDSDAGRGDLDVGHDYLAIAVAEMVLAMLGDDTLKAAQDDLAAASLLIGDTDELLLEQASRLAGSIMPRRASA